MKIELDFYDTEIHKLVWNHKNICQKNLSCNCQGMSMELYISGLNLHEDTCRIARTQGTKWLLCTRDVVMVICN